MLKYHSCICCFTLNVICINYHFVIKYHFVLNVIFANYRFISNILLFSIRLVCVFIYVFIFMFFMLLILFSFYFCSLLFLFHWAKPECLKPNNSKPPLCWAQHPSLAYQPSPASLCPHLRATHTFPRHNHPWHQPKPVPARLWASHSPTQAHLPWRQHTHTVPSTSPITKLCRLWHLSQTRTS